MKDSDTMRPLVLAVDDDPHILQFIKVELLANDINVITAANGETALQVLRDQSPDVILLDVIMPDMDGLELMRRIREVSSVPIVLLTARRRDHDKIQGLNLGADDYLPKPFNPEELTARIRAILRRGKQPQQRATIRYGDVEINLAKRFVSKNGETIPLTRTEWLVLQYLAANAGRVILNAELLTRVWGVEYSNDLQYLRVWISRLRSKLGSHSIIQTLSGIGYKLDADEVPESDAERRLAAHSA
jgi:two-component system, OmpR family, KDP operon response regulator KdpE